jgi:hypothetical protein
MPIELLLCAGLWQVWPNNYANFGLNGCLFNTACDIELKGLNKLIACGASDQFMDTGKAKRQIVTILSF